MYDNANFFNFIKLHVITFLTIPYLGLTHVCVKRYDVSMREHSWAHYHNCAIDRIFGPKIRKSLKIGIWKPEYFHLKPLMHRMNLTKDLCPYLVWITSYRLLRTIDRFQATIPGIPGLTAEQIWSYSGI